MQRDEIAPRLFVDANANKEENGIKIFAPATYKKSSQDEIKQKGREENAIAE